MTRSLKLALEKVDFLPPTRVTDDTSVLTLKNLVFEPLLRWDRGLACPALFHRWTHSEDGRSWRFFIRPGARFHDGEACRAEHVIDFVAAICGAVDTFGMKWSYSRYLAHAVFSVDAENSVRVENPEPIADILDILSEFYLCRVGPDGAPTLGTGRYRVIDFEPRRLAILQRCGDCGGPAAVIAQEDASADERYRMLRDGVVNVALNLERSHDAPDFDPAFVWGRVLNTLSVMYYLNCASGLFASHEARLAANLAVDVSRLITDIYHGLGAAAASVVSPHHLGMASAGVDPIPYDPARARRLLDRVGGTRDIRLRTPTCMPERALEASRFVAAQLEEVGLSVTLDIVTDRPDYARQVGRKEIGDLAIFDSSPHSTYRVLNDKISSAVKAVWWQGFDDAKTEELIVAANRAVEPQTREAAYGRCLRRLNAQPPWLYLFHPIELFAAQRGIDGLSIDPKGSLVIA